ncbi:MAG: 1-acyl-sn-glycerol-3-phosphate acyltransferase [Magnetococcus sp. DMHC-1]
MMTNPLHGILPRICVWLYYRNLRIVHRSRLALKGPVLFSALHRNGAVDGFVYGVAVNFPTFMIASQLRRSRLGRLFFSGIEVVRTGDRKAGIDAAAINQMAMEHALDLLWHGGRLGIFPEGTSNLGPSHLPFQSGAARLLARSWEKGIPLALIPLGIHYECAWCWGGRVEVVVGTPLHRPEGKGSMTGSELVRFCKNSIRQGMEEVGVNFVDADLQERVEQAAFLAVASHKGGYFAHLKAWEKGLPPAVEISLRRLADSVQGKPHLRYRGIPLFPETGLIRAAAGLFILSPLALFSLLVNAGPVFLAFWAGKRFPDGRNVITLWRLLVGVPALVLWVTGWIAAFLTLHQPLLLAGYLALTWIGGMTIPLVHRQGVALCNGLLHPQGREAFRELREILSQYAPRIDPTTLDAMNPVGTHRA